MAAHNHLRPAEHCPALRHNTQRQDGRCDYCTYRVRPWLRVNRGAALVDVGELALHSPTRRNAERTRTAVDPDELERITDTYGYCHW